MATKDAQQQKSKHANSDSFLSKLKMKALPTFHQVKMRHSEKNFLFLHKSISIQKNFLCLK